MNRPWRNEAEERCKAEQTARNTHEAARHAEEYRPPQPPAENGEDENGFVDLANYRIPGMVWSAEHADDEDQPRLSWLHGRSA